VLAGVDGVLAGVAGVLAGVPLLLLHTELKSNVCAGIISIGGFGLQSDRLGLLPVHIVAPTFSWMLLALPLTVASMNAP
jgi:hypothetical protein